MKKIICVVMCIVLTAALFMFTGCSKSEEMTYDVVLITDGGTIDDGSYNQSTWNGIKQYAESTNETYRYYQPVLQDGVITLENAEKYVSMAANGGAKFIILPTNAFDDIIDDIASNYTDISFIVIDSDYMRSLDNVMPIQFDSLQSGFLAGYMAVLSGNVELGYLGSSVSSKSKDYGAGFVQGASYASEEIGIPVVLDYADYDDFALKDNYSVTITANYEKIEDLSKTCYVVNIVNGTGSGTYTDGSNVTVTADPAPKGMVFDHWECTSNTEKVKDSKVNISSKTKTEMNLLVEKCDCTITAVYTETDAETYGVVVKTADNSANYSEQYIEAGASCSVTAPPAESGMVFDHWTANVDESVLDDINSRTTTVYMPSEGAEDIELIPVYVESDVPTFDITVVTGEGGSGESSESGSYEIGETVQLSAAVPEEGYIFSNWSNMDKDGYSVGITMGDEFYPYTSFSMVNLYQSVVETMYDKGDTLIYSGGNDQINAVSDATWSFAFQVWAIGSENYQSSWTNYYTTTMKEYGNIVQLCLENFKGGSSILGDCSNNGISLSYVPEESTDQYNDVYQKIADGEINLNDVCFSSNAAKSFSSNLLIINILAV